MSPVVYVQPVKAEVELDRHLHCGDELIVERRQQARVGEWVVVECGAGTCVGLYSEDTELLLHRLETPGQPLAVQRSDISVSGVVIGMRSAL